jgi:hypothetical protein
MEGYITGVGILEQSNTSEWFCLTEQTPDLEDEIHMLPKLIPIYAANT